MYLLLAYLMLAVAAVCIAVSRLLDATFAPVLALAGGMAVIIAVAALGERHARGSRWGTRRAGHPWSAG